MSDDRIKELILDSTSFERKIEIIKEITSERLKGILGTDYIPSELNYIVDEVSIKRFNRLGSEGYKTHRQEGLVLEFEESDFDEFADDINRWLDKNKPSQNRKGWVLYNA